jgi:hypothetical protein
VELSSFLLCEQTSFLSWATSPRVRVEPDEEVLQGILLPASMERDEGFAADLFGVQVETEIELAW